MRYTQRETLGLEAESNLAAHRWFWAVFIVGPAL